MDIFLFKYKDSYLLHRIVKKNNEILLLQGDAVTKTYGKNKNRMRLHYYSKLREKTEKQ